MAFAFAFAFEFMFEVGRFAFEFMLEAAGLLGATGAGVAAFAGLVLLLLVVLLVAAPPQAIPNVPKANIAVSAIFFMILDLLPSSKS